MLAPKREAKANRERENGRDLLPVDNYGKADIADALSSDHGGSAPSLRLSRPAGTGLSHSAFGGSPRAEID
jgi:hypothetical protein